MATNLDMLGNYTSPVRKIGAKMEFASGDEAITFTEQDNLKSARVERIGDASKFFGYGVSQKLNIKALDINRDISLTTSHKGKLSFSINNGSYYTASPTFKISETHRDEVTGELSITAYDLLREAANYTVDDLELVAPYTIQDVITQIGAKLGAKDTIVYHGSINLAKPVAQWNFVNGAYIDGDYIVLPEVNSIASVEIAWNKRANYFYISAVTDSTAANYGVQISTVYYDANGEMLSANGDYDASLNGEYAYNWSSKHLSETYRVPISNATKITLSFKRNSQYTPAPYKFKDVMFCIDSAPYKKYQSTNFNNYSYKDGANFDGTETLQEVLIAAAEATQTIY